MQGGLAMKAMIVEDMREKVCVELVRDQMRTLGYPIDDISDSLIIEAVERIVQTAGEAQER
jgi:hypothetical protein